MHFSKPVLGTPLDWENPLNDNLRLALPLNEGHGDVVRDLSGHGNHGTLGGFAFPPTVASGWNPGQTGRGLNFDGASDNVRIPDSESLSPTSAMTAMVWVKGATQNNKGILSHYDAGISQRAVMIWSSGELSEMVISSDGTLDAGHTKRYRSSIVAFDSTWHLIGFTFDAGTLKLFVDGVEDTNPTKTNDDAITTIHNSTADVMLGCFLSSDTPAGFFNGGIDQPRIVAGAWTAKQCMDYAINPWQVYLDEDD